MTRDDDGISRRSMLFGRFRRPDEPKADAEHHEPPPPRVHRPPGAVDEARFLRDCTRCGDCITACPVDAIRIAAPRYGPAAGTPIIEPMEAACVMCEDLPCIASCEPGVLSPDEPVAMGTASIRDPYCLAHQGTICTVCFERCPVEGALEIVAGRPRIDVGACTGCGTCQYVCPAPYNAVLILPHERAGAPSDDDAPPSSDEPTDDRPAWRRALDGRDLSPPFDDPLPG